LNYTSDNTYKQETKKSPQNIAQNIGQNKVVESFSNYYSKLRNFYSTNTVFSRLNNVGQVLPNSWTAKCLKLPLPTATNIPVLYSTNLKFASYANLLMCKSIWLCPFCSKKITNFRRKELKELIADPGLLSSMLTLTIQHSKKDSLKGLLDQLTTSLRNLKNSKKFKSHMQEVGIIGTVRGLEIIYGENGWNAHYHIILIANRELAGIEFNEDFAKALWAKIVRRTNGYASKKYGLKYSPGRDNVNLYASKWGLDQELTSQKSSHGINPFQMLDNLTPTNIKLFQEYAAAIKGRKQLLYSKGLKKILKMAVVSDKTITEDVSKFDVIIALITREGWTNILDKQVRGELLAVASTGDINELFNYLSHVLTRDQFKIINEYISQVQK